MALSQFLGGSSSVSTAGALVGWLIGTLLGLAQSPACLERAGRREPGMWAVVETFPLPTQTHI